MSELDVPIIPPASSARKIVEDRKKRQAEEYEREAYNSLQYDVSQRIGDEADKGNTSCVYYLRFAKVALLDIVREQKAGAKPSKHEGDVDYRLAKALIKELRGKSHGYGVRGATNKDVTSAKERSYIDDFMVISW